MLFSRKKAVDWKDDSFDPSTAVFTPNSEAEKRLVRKIDMHIVCSILNLYLPFVDIIY